MKQQTLDGIHFDNEDESWNFWQESLIKDDLIWEPCLDCENGSWVINKDFLGCPVCPVKPNA